MEVGNKNTPSHQIEAVPDGETWVFVVEVKYLRLLAAAPQEFSTFGNCNAHLHREECFRGPVRPRPKCDRVPRDHARDEVVDGGNLHRLNVGNVVEVADAARARRN